MCMNKAKDKFRKELEANPELLEMLSSDRLKILKEYYDELIDEAEKKLEKNHKYR